MNMLAAAVLLAAAAMAAPQGPGGFPRGPGFPPRPVFPPIGPQGFVPIVSQNYDLNIDGSYNFNYESADGSTRHETGVLNNPGTPVEASAVTGSYSYIGTDGVPVTVNYIADENGFQPIGNVIHPQISRAVADQVAFEKGAVPAGPFDPRFPPVRPF